MSKTGMEKEQHIVVIKFHLIALMINALLWL